MRFLSLCSAVLAGIAFLSSPAEAIIAAPEDHPKFVTPYKQPPLAVGKFESGNPLEIYEIAVRESVQDLGLFHDDGTPFTNGTRMFTYCDILRDPVNGGCSYPGPLFDVENGRPIRVRWMNQLPLNHIFEEALNASRSTHHCGLHAAACAPDTRHTTHLHGGHTLTQYDGLPNSWHAPFTYGEKRNRRADLNADHEGVPSIHGSDMHTHLIHGQGYFGPETLYSNEEIAPSTYWYHDHSMGTTRLNLYAGELGMYLVRSNYEVMKLGLPIQRTKKWNRAGGEEFTLVIQDKDFDENGQLRVPAGLPLSNYMLVNGVAWPYAKVRPATHRLRILNAGDFRYLRIAFTRDDPNGNPSNDPALDVPIKFRIIGSDGALLPSAQTVTEVTIGPAERLDLLVDLSEFAGMNITMRNTAPDGIFPLFPAAAHNGPTNLLMRFVVDSTGRVAPLQLPRNLAPAPDYPSATCLYGPANSPFGRQSTSWGGASQVTDYADDLAALPGAQVGNANATTGPMVPYTPQFNYNIDYYREIYVAATTQEGVVQQRWVPNFPGYDPGLRHDDPTTEIAIAGQVEEWVVFNPQALAHALHIHQVQWRVIGRRPINGSAVVEGEPIPFTGPMTPPELHELGWKDTARMDPESALILHIRFQVPGYYLYHCHMITHEDNEMMRPIIVLPSDEFGRQWRRCHEDQTPRQDSYGTYRNAELKRKRAAQLKDSTDSDDSDDSL